MLLQVGSARRPSLPILTSSSAKTFRRCAREYHYRYELQRVPTSRPGDARDFGTLIHVGLEAWWNAVGLSLNTEETLIRTWEAMRAKNPEALDLIRAEELMLGYHVRWFDESSAQYDVLGVELEFVAPLVNPDTGAPSRTFERAGKLDLLLRERSSQRVLVGEHKTTSEQMEAGDTYWRQLTLDSQVSTYLEGSKALGVDVAACLYDVIGKPKLEPYEATPVEIRKYTKPTKANPEPRLYANQRAEDETPVEFRERFRAHIQGNIERYFRRGEIVRLEDETAEAMFDDWRVGKQIRESQIAQRWPRNVDSCRRFGRLCSYHPVCTRTQEIDDPLFYRVERAHGELSKETTEVMEAKESRGVERAEQPAIF